MGRVEEQVVVERHADVQGAGQSHRPPAQPLAAAGQKEESAEANHQRERQHERDRDFLEHRAAEREKQAERVEQPGRCAGAHVVGQAIELVKRQAADDEDQRVHAVDPGEHQTDDDPEDDECTEDADHQRAELPTAGHRRVAGGQLATTSSAGRAPKRLTREA